MSDALSYVWSLDGVGTAIVGCSTVDEVRENAQTARQFKTLPADRMADLEARIVEELEYQPDHDSWAPAIRADPRDAGMSPEEAARMRDMMRRMLERRGGR